MPKDYIPRSLAVLPAAPVAAPRVGTVECLGEGIAGHGNIKPRLVTVPRRGERAGPPQRRLGFQGHPDAVATVFENLEVGSSIDAPRFLPVKPGGSDAHPV